MGVLGLSHIHKAHLILSLGEVLRRKSIVLVPDEAQASRMTEDLCAFGLRAFHFPARTFVMRTSEIGSREYEHQRLRVLYRMQEGSYDAVVCSAEAALQLTMPPDVFARCCFTLRADEDMPIDELRGALLRAGYVASSQVDGEGQFSVRGGIVDFYPPGSEYPCRCEFFGDTVDSIAYFEPESQRRTQSLREVTVPPGVERIGDHAFGVYFFFKYIDGFKFPYEEYRVYDGFRLHCGKGSAAESYAKKNGLTCFTSL